MPRIDAGPFAALVEKNQPQSARCRSILITLALPLLTTWPAFTEAMDLVCRLGGWPCQSVRTPLPLLPPSGGTKAPHFRRAPRKHGPVLSSGRASCPMSAGVAAPHCSPLHFSCSPSIFGQFGVPLALGLALKIPINKAKGTRTSLAFGLLSLLYCLEK